MGTPTVDLRKASGVDVDIVVRLIHGASDWLKARGTNQWPVSDELDQEIAQRVQSGETYLATMEGTTVGCVRMQATDPIFWPEKSDSASYIHKLVVDRPFSGRGLGLAILAACELVSQANGVEVLRLDTDARCAPLLRLYREAGFSLVDECDVDGWLAARMEKVL
jgi:ribosomal protein S18 acetylase RimI-like enzyme